MPKTALLILILLVSTLTLGLLATQTGAAEVVIVGDTRLKLVAEVVSGIRKTLRSSISIYSPAEVKGTLQRIVRNEQPRIVIALGREALGEAQNLPGDIPVIYGFVLTPPAVNRGNTTGIYMATPAREYAELLGKHLHSIKNVAIIGNSDQLRILNGNALPRWDGYSVNSSAELIDILKQLNRKDAILLLPNVSLLTSAAMTETYLLSFRRGIPLLGVSERQVRDGALLALVADLAEMGRQIGEYATMVNSGTRIEHLPPAPAKRFDLYLNRETARKMGIPMSDGLLNAAKRVYP